MADFSRSVVEVDLAQVAKLPGHLVVGDFSFFAGIVVRGTRILRADTAYVTAFATRSTLRIEGGAFGRLVLPDAWYSCT